jgi:hypothetical protein
MKTDDWKIRSDGRRGLDNIMIYDMQGDAGTRSETHRRTISTISLRFLGIILRGLRLEVSYTMYCIHYKQVSTTFAGGGRGERVKFVSRGDCE